MLALYLNGAEQNTWDELLPELSLAINSSISDTTGFSPAFIMQGREPRLPNTLFGQATPGHTSNQPSPGKKAEQMRELFRLVKDNSERASNEQRRHYNLRRRKWRPAVGTPSPSRAIKGLIGIHSKTCGQIRRAIQGAQVPAS